MDDGHNLGGVANTLQKAYSVAKIEHPEVMDENGKQKVGGLMDPRMGSEYTSLPLTRKDSY